MFSFDSSFLPLSWWFFSCLGCATFLLLLFLKEIYYIIHVFTSVMDISKFRLRNLFFPPRWSCLKKTRNIWNWISINYERVKLFSTGFPKSKLLCSSENEYLHRSVTQCWPGTDRYPTCREATDFREVNLMGILIETRLGKEHARQVHSSLRWIFPFIASSLC